MNRNTEPDRVAIRGPQMARDLTSAGIRLPKPATAAVEAHSAAKAALAALPTVDAARADLAARIAADPMIDHHDAAATVAALPELRAAHIEAVRLTGRKLSATIDAHADRLVQMIGSTIAQPAIDSLTKIANATGSSDTAGSLTRAGRHDDARLLLEADFATERLMLARRLRASVYSGARVDRIGHAMWEHPELRPMLPETTAPTVHYLEGIRSGAGLVWRTLSEAQDAERTARREEAAAKPPPTPRASRVRSFK